MLGKTGSFDYCNIIIITRFFFKFVCIISFCALMLLKYLELLDETSADLMFDVYYLDRLS